ASTGGNVTGLYIAGSGTTTGINSMVKVRVHGLSTAAASGVVRGVHIVGGEQQTLHRSSIYGLEATGANGRVGGISVEGGTTVVLYNNVIAGLSAPNSNGTDQIRGIELASATASTFRDIHFNTVYVNAQSTGANFGTSALYHMASGTAGAGDLTLKNNILVNRSTPNGSGTTAALRRSSSALANY